VMAFPVYEYNILSFFRNKNPEKPDTSALSTDMDNRRKFLKGLVTLPFATGVIYAAAAKAEESAYNGSTGATMTLTDFNLSDLKGTLPKGKIGDIEMSRLILGCNLITGASHSRDLHYVGRLFRQYNTDKKIFETYSLAERAGIDTTNVVLGSFPFLNHYKKISGSRMQTIAKISVKPDEDDPLVDFKKARDYGATSIYVQGACGDRLTRDGKLEFIEQAIDFTRQQGIIAGVGAHSIQVIIACENAGIKPDYYFKTVHHDNYWSAHPREFRKEFEVDMGKS